MMILVTGGSASGKSEFAEEILEKMPGKHYYVATMHKTEDEETVKRILRHVKLREKRGFETIEQETNLGQVMEAGKMYREDSKEVSKEASVMVECLSNLLANEMYLAGRMDAKQYIPEQVQMLKERCANLIVVTNEVSSDGLEYDDFTMNYIKNLGEINGKLACMADYVVEVVYGIPVFLKGSQETLGKETFRGEALKTEILREEGFLEDI